MMNERQRFQRAMVGLILLTGLAACGGNGSNDGDRTATPTVQTTGVATATRTRTQTPRPTRTPLEGATVTGLVVVNGSVSGRTDESLGLPPSAWTADARNVAFDKALGLADWTVAENETIQ